MKKIGIVTIHDLNNYGNRLQNYAVYRVLNNMGFQAVSYAYPIKRVYTAKVKIKYWILKCTGFRLTSAPDAWRESRKQWKMAEKRFKTFQQFTERYIPTEYISETKSLAEKADYFVLGSDQVWNVTWFNEQKKDLFLLTFAKPAQKVCFSPSFGIEQLPEEWASWFQEHLKSFPSFSVREEAGVKIIKELTGRNAQVTIDPTLMLDAEEWMKVGQKPRSIDTEKPYILTYFLGDCPKAAQRDIDALNHDNQYTVHRLLDRMNSDIYACGPGEFIYLFSKADIVLTDSFHACVFSFLFDKPFLVYDREQDGCPQMNSRLETLLPMLHIERKYRNLGLPNDILEHNYAEGREVLQRKRQELLDYLTSAMQK